MKAMACRICGTRIPESSIRCPYCYRFQWRGIGMIAVVAVAFLSAVAGGAWLVTGPHPDTVNLPAEIQPEAITPFESGPAKPLVEPRHSGPAIGYQESETPNPGFLPVEKKQADRLPPVESPAVQSARPAQQNHQSQPEKAAAETASPPVKAGDSPSNDSLEKNEGGGPQGQKRRTEDATAEVSGPQRPSGTEPAHAPPEQVPVRSMQMPVTNALAGPGPTVEEPASNAGGGPETGTETPQP